MSDENPESPRTQRENVIADLRVLERLLNRLLKRAMTHAGLGKVADRLEEILLVSDSLGILIDRLQEIETKKEKPQI